VDRRDHTISLVIPTLNEEKAIGKVLVEIPRDIVDEVIIVDSSTDNTPKIAEDMEAKVIRELRKGYGRALQTGIENAMGDIVVYMDGDHSYDSQEISKMVQPILDGEHDIVLGCRISHKMLPKSMNFLNKFGNLALSLIFDLFFLKKVKDTQSGFRAVKKVFLKNLTYLDYGMPYVTEQLIKLAKGGARIGEVPITYRPRIGETKLCAWTDGFKILKCVFKERFRGS